ncbi:MAG: MMPL family transporter [Holophagales bacterium]|jgi:predicted RND superfamily exporter protein|nr:MMPL family transporter [Holophagales bacterium]
MKLFLRYLLLQHLRRPKGLWALVGAITVVLGLGALRIERRLDLMSLLPSDHPIVRASIQAGIGQQELLWIVAEGTPQDLENRRAWADRIIERLLDMSAMPLNGISAEGSVSPPMPVPNAKGVSLWPPLLAAGSLLDGDSDVGRMLTERLYAMGPMLLGNNLEPLRDPDQLRERFKATVKALASPEPVKAKLAQLDPLSLRDLIPMDSVSVGSATRAFNAIPLKIRAGYLETKDSRYLLVPLVLDFQNGETAATARILAWIGNACAGAPPNRASFDDVNTALFTTADRPFPIKVTGAHAIAYWESLRLGKEVAVSLCLSFALIGVVYWIGFRTFAGYGFVVIPLLLGMFWALGLAGWILGRLNLMAAAFGAVLLGVGDDVGILIFSRYRDERAAGINKSVALRAALLSTGPGVIAGMSATSLVFLACVFAPFPGLRDLGLTAGLGILSCLASTFLLMPPMLLTLDKGKGFFAPNARGIQSRMSRPSRRKALFTVGVIFLACLGISRLTWEEDLRKFRQAGNPALSLQEDLGKTLGAGLQPLAIQIPFEGDEPFPVRWNKIADILNAEGLPLPQWASMNSELSKTLSSRAWLRQALKLAEKEGLDPSVLEPFLASLSAGVSDPLTAPRSLLGLINTPQKLFGGSLLTFAKHGGGISERYSMFTLPIRLPESAQDRVEAALEDTGARLIGTRPLFRAIKSVAKNSIQSVILVGAACIIGIAAIFGRRWLFLALALIPMAAGQIAVFGTLGWTGEPLTFLSLIAIPVALGVSVDTVFNLLNRAKLEVNAPAKVSRVNAVCAGTTLAGFGGLAFSAYRGLQGLGIAAIGGTALALLTTQWLLPWILEKWPLKKL